jgi:ribosomal protein S18 acetylase RimI-like enzyme
MNASLNIIQIDVTQAQILSELAKQIYIPHYPYLWEPGGVDWYVNEYAYPVEKIKAEINDQNNLHYIAYLDKVAIGYLKINIIAKGNSNGTLDVDSAMELERIYIDTKCIQKGIGTQLMKFVFDLAKQYQKTTIVLKAMDSASKALNFYNKMGFEIIDNFRLPDHIFTLMKPEYRGMLILKRPIYH